MSDVMVNKKERNTGLDLLRCLAMMMIVVLHYLGKGKLLPDMALESSWNAVSITAWCLESVCAISVNLYMLISGYVLCESHFKLSRLVSLYLTLWVYSAGVGFGLQALNMVPADKINTYNYLIELLPVSMGHYWYMTAYIYLFLLLPVIGVACRKLSRKQLKVTIIMLLIAHSVIKSVLPVKLEMDTEGYDFMWYTVLFLTAAYIRLYKPAFLKKSTGFCLFAVGVIGSFAEILGVGYFGMKHEGALELIRTVSLNYNHVFSFCGAVGLFTVFKDIRLKGGFAKAVTWISGYTLGVYLLHENIRARYLWQEWFKCNEITSVISLIGFTLLAMVTVFACGIIVDFLRDLLFKGLHKLLKFIPPYKKLCQGVEKINKLFSEF